MKILAGVPLALLAVMALSCTPSSTPTAPPVENRYGAPTASDPRDVRPFAARPCEGPWSERTFPDLGFATPGRPRPVIMDLQSCYWRDRTTKQEFSLIVHPADDILASTYRVRLFSIFQPTVIGGLPAVREQSEPESISCTITVGTGNDQGFVTTYTQLEVGSGERADDPCGRGERIVGQIIALLPPLTQK